MFKSPRFLPWFMFVTDDETGGGGDDTPPALKADDKGFPADTPLSEMTAEQQAAYYKHQNRKAEKQRDQYKRELDQKAI